MKIISKNSIIAQSIVFIMISIVLIGLACYGFIKPKQEANQMALIKVNSLKECNRDLNKFGFRGTLDPQKSTVTFVKNDLTGWDADLALSSYVIKECKNMNLTYFCMGSQCKDQFGTLMYGTTMTLTYAEPMNSKK